MKQKQCDQLLKSGISHYEIISESTLKYSVNAVKPKEKSIPMTSGELIELSKYCESFIGADKSPLTRASKERQNQCPRSRKECLRKASPKWTEDEINILKLGIELFGPRMDLVKAHFPDQLKHRTIPALKKRAKMVME